MVMTENKYTIGLVEDDPVYAAYLTGGLRKAGFECVAILNFEEEVYLNPELDVNLFLVDFHLGTATRNGLDVCRRITQERDLPVIMLTAEKSPDVILNCLEAGAEQYVNKPCGIQELSVRIRAALRAVDAIKERSGKKIAEDLRFRNIELSDGQGTITCGGRSVSLTQRELELAKFLFSEPDKEWSREEVFEKLFGFDMPPFNRAVDVVVARFRKKLAEISSEIEVKSIRNHGYILQMVDQ